MSDRPKGKISLLLADVDGTVVTKDKVLTERAVKAVAALEAAGIRFAVTSGRPPRGMAMLIAPLHITTMIAGFNGGALVRPDLSVIEEKTLPPDVTREAIRIIADHGLDAWLYTAKGWFITKRGAPHVEREAWTVKFAAEVVDAFADEDLDRATKVVGVSDDLKAVETAERDMRAALGDRASAARSQPYYLDVTHPHANKGDVVEVLSKAMNIPTSEIATIGDMPNDVDMFKRSGFSIAMGNASDEVKAQASAVTAGYDDEGFAKAIETFLLPPAEPT
ncbi:HAD family phosphatase [Lichenibacterium minor]|uniref:HAD family phosphatase n=1 Tax=Lichenibacterium minor TaxID=2316528 RepID=A0A4Q2U327_9HYPH|nr:Cof-type HAD-IIB family hydrolase [Lichenibacterium minor]RYC30590.1 HAD family phosphatase [Lichenibacterium minor]